MGFHRAVAPALCLFLVSFPAWAQTSPPSVSAEDQFAASSQTAAVVGPATMSPAECTPCIRTNLEYLAGPELHGRGSETDDEHRTAEFIAAKLRSYGLAPAAEKGRYIQTATIESRKVIAPPILSFEVRQGNQSSVVAWTHGKEIEVRRLSQPDVSGRLQKLNVGDPAATAAQVVQGTVLLLKLESGLGSSAVQAVIAGFNDSKAAMLIVSQSAGSTSPSSQPPKLPQLPVQFGNEEPKWKPTLVVATPEAFAQLWALPDDTTIKLHAETSRWKTKHTWNVLAKLEGTREKDQVILLSAHLDHLGIRNGETYYGADDDASGTAAVMELARAMAREPRPARTVVFALWGSEELGMLGARYFLQYPSFDLNSIVANLEFEMIARPDPKLKAYQVWLTGWDRSNLGQELVAHGADLVGDPHPEEEFFQRSDNYALAQRGIIAHTISSYGLHKDYHRPTDTLDKVDWKHLDRAIGSMIGPLTWLANSDFTPEWNSGQRP